MARKVKCANCGNQGTNETFFKVAMNKEGNRFKYYCNEEEYQQVQDKLKAKEEEKARRKAEAAKKAVHDEADKAVYNELISFVIDDILEYDRNMIFPTAMVKRIRKLRENFEYSIIRETFAVNKDSIKWAIKNKDFDTEWHMVSYVMAIVEGSINDIYKKQKEIERLQARINANNHDLAAQFSLDDLTEKKPQQTKQHTKKKGIKSFLEDDDI